jgi:uncharacterized protein
LSFTRRGEKQHTQRDIDHFYTKLFQLADRMTTTAGRPAAAKRTAFLHALVDQLHDEIQ